MKGAKKHRNGLVDLAHPFDMRLVAVQSGCALGFLNVTVVADLILDLGFLTEKEHISAGSVKSQ